MVSRQELVGMIWNAARASGAYDAAKANSNPGFQPDSELAQLARSIMVTANRVHAANEWVGRMQARQVAERIERERVIESFAVAGRVFGPLRAEDFL